jgi:hypothetical protein
MAQCPLFEGWTVFTSNLYQDLGYNWLVVPPTFTGTGLLSIMVSKWEP